jgi:hypothetical protein
MRFILTLRERASSEFDLSSSEASFVSLCEKKEQIAFPPSLYKVFPSAVNIYVRRARSEEILPKVPARSLYAALTTRGNFIPGIKYLAFLSSCRGSVDDKFHLGPIYGIPCPDHQGGRSPTT